MKSGAVIIATFDHKWVLNQRDAEVLPVERTLMLLEEVLGQNAPYKVLKKDFVHCQVQVEDGECARRVQADLIQLLQKEYQLADGQFTLEVQEVPEGGDGPAQIQAEQAGAHTARAPQPDAASPAPKTLPEDRPSQAADEGPQPQPHDEVMEKIGLLVGAEEFKSLCSQLVQMQEELRKPELLQAFLSHRYLFSVNDGNGYAQGVELFADLLSALGLFAFNNQKRKVRFFSFPQSTDPRERKAQLDRVKDFYDKNGSFSGVVALDISSWISAHQGRELTGLLRHIYPLSSQFLTIFRIPYVEEHVLKNVYEELADVLNITQVVFLPPSKEEYWRYAQGFLEKSGFSLDPGLESVFYNLLAQEQQDGRFYGVDTVDKVINSILYNNLLKAKELGLPAQVIQTGHIPREQAQDSPRKAEAMLKDLIGLDKVKEQLLSIVNQIEASRQLFGEDRKPPCIHMRFTGNPGTGKTTVARILGRMLKERKLLQVGRFYEVGRADLCGRYVGETAPKTILACQNALGSVLFIDEAYALSSYDSGRFDYGQEAIDALVSFMENHRDQLVIIMAGYKNEMDEMLTRNPGLASRVPYEINFPNYSREALHEMFMANIHPTFQYDEGFVQAVRDFFNHIKEEQFEDRSFGNGRIVRNLYERIWGKAVMRQRIEKGSALMLQACDVQQACQDQEFQALISEKTTSRRMGFQS